MRVLSDHTPQLRVLVIDDCVDNAQALCAVLAVMGCETAIAFSGRLGLAAATGFDPDLAFIDLDMPDMGGCEAARQWRAARPQGKARLICLTGRSQAQDRRNCLEAGFDEFFTKPIAPDSLARVVAASSAVLQAAWAGGHRSRVTPG